MFWNFKTAEHLLLETMDTELNGLFFSKRKHSSLFFFFFWRFWFLLIISFSKTSVIDFANFSFSYGKGRLHTNFFSILPNILIEKKWRETCSVRSQGVSFFMSVFRVSGFFIVEKNVIFSPALACCSLHDTFPFFLTESGSSVLPQVPGAGLWDKVNSFSVIHLWLNNRDPRGLGILVRKYSLVNNWQITLHRTFKIKSIHVVFIPVVHKVYFKTCF